MTNSNQCHGELAIIAWMSNFRPGTVTITRPSLVGLPQAHGEYCVGTLLELGIKGLYTFIADYSAEKEPEGTIQMKNTKEQLDFFGAVELRTDNIILESVAGSGKTTSIVQCLNYIEDDWPILACSFTKLAATQLDTRIRAQNFTNVNSSTLNSVGWGICRQNVRGCQIDANKTVNILREIINRRDWACDPKKLYKSLSGPIKRIVGLLKSYVVRPDEENVEARIDELAQFHSIDLPDGDSGEAKVARDHFRNLAAWVYLRSIEITNMMDFDDQKFFPVLFHWTAPLYKIVIVDECQDCNPCDLELVALLAQRGARTIWVGDRMQAIYFFRGSLLNAMDVIKDAFNCHYMTLSVCWRAADDILIEAKEINPLIKSPEPNPKGKGIVGNVTTAEFLNSVRIGDYVICRTTAPLVKRCLGLVKMGKPAKVKGREVGRSLLALIEKIGELPIPQFIEALLEYKLHQVEVLTAMNREDAAIRIQDEAEALEYFCTEARTLNEVADKIATIFTDDDDDESVILLLTGHKAKGLEADRVFLLRGDLCPHPMAKSEVEKEVERRIRYVMVTRAALERYEVIPEKDELKSK